MRNLLFSFVFGSLVACAPQHQVGPSPVEIGIVGGQPISARSPVARSVVAILGRSSGGGYLCTGVLVGKNTVLTAAHCGVDLEQGEILFSTQLSTSDARARRPIVSAEIEGRFPEAQNQIAARPRRNPNSIKNWGDLALVRFSGAIPAGYGVALRSDSGTLGDGEKVILAGFGLTDGENHIQARELRAVEVPIAKAKYSRTEFTVDASGAKGACHGDSGGPAFVVENNQLILVGITSRGFDSACIEASIYTRVSAFKKWLNANLQGE